MGVFSISEFNDRTTPFNISLTIGIPNQSPNIHAGIIYRNDSKIKFLHLAWDIDLKLEEDFSDYTVFKWVHFQYFLKGDLNDVRKKSAIRFFEMVFRKNKNNIPYGTFYKYSKISPDGEFILGEGEHGLSCATFIIAIFESIGVFLVDKKSWKYDPEDDIWRDSMIDIINEKLPDYKHVAQVFELEKGKPRYKPEQIVGASMNTKIPSDYQYCTKQGDEIAMILTT